MKTTPEKTATTRKLSCMEIEKLYAEHSKGERGPLPSEYLQWFKKSGKKKKNKSGKKSGKKKKSGKSADKKAKLDKKSGEDKSGKEESGKTFVGGAEMTPELKQKIIDVYLASSAGYDVVRKRVHSYAWHYERKRVEEILPACEASHRAGAVAAEALQFWESQWAE